jgi:hypothetical protein
LDRKTTRQHSPLSRALLDPKDFTLHLNREASDFIGDSFQINFECQTRANRRTTRRKNKRAVLTHVTAAAFSLPRLPVPIRPPECDCRLQQEPEGLSRWPYKIQLAPPPLSRIAH